MGKHVGAILACALGAGIAVGATPPPYTKNVAILLYDGVEILDFAGPAEVFEAAAGYGASGQERAFKVFTVSRTKDKIVSQGFINVVPNYGIADSPRPDILVLPGGGSQAVTNDAAWMEWVKRVGAGADNVLTVCTGAFIAGKAGLLEGADATTWYNAVPRLAAEFPKTHAIPGRRFIDSGKVITTAGVSAGIDGSLHLVARLLGRYVADRTAEYMEYKWAPESYLSSHYTQLNPRLDDRGRVLQQAAITVKEGNVEAAMAAYRALIAKDASDAEAWLELGRALHVRKQYREAIEANLHAVEGAAQRAKASFNLACSYALLGEKEKALDAAAEAVSAGYRVKWFYENDPDLASIRDEPRFRTLLASL
jgi:transcriptional regulator GlxA family with amidase domain